MQLSLEQLTEDYTSNLPPYVSVSILVMNNHTGGVEAYIGSSDFFNLSRFGHVDMVKAMRSPGSTVKPFIFGIALDQGLIHSQSLLMDVPINFDGYKPVNFHRSFNGPVSVSKALSSSLNLPAVQLLDHIEPRFFYSQMVNSGFTIKLPGGATPNLSMALGGFATNLENLVRVYSSLGRGGETIKPRFIKESEIIKQSLLSPGAAWIIQEILLTKSNRKMVSGNKSFALKTGTSYGFRDAWALGVDKGYTAGVWIGRPDGTPVPGFYGSQAAKPLLKRVFQFLPQHKFMIKRPDSVTGNKICWPDSQTAFINEEGKYNCESPRNAWILERTTPGTLSSRKNSMESAIIELNLKLTRDRKYRIPYGCNTEKQTVNSNIKLWPKALESWLPYSFRRKKLIPPVFPDCSKKPDIIIEEPVLIEGLTDGEMIIKKDKNSNYPAFNLSVQGGNGPWYWFENSLMVKEGVKYKFEPQHPGQYQLLVVDQSGEMDQVSVQVF